MVKRTPQEKKELSYAKDGRNTLHENDKASRRLIPLRKAKANRAYRKKANEALNEVLTAAGDEEQIELAESKSLATKKPDWEKYPDTPLGEVVEKQLKRRIDHAGNGKTAQKKIREFVASLKVETEQKTDGRWIAEAIEMNGVIVYGETQEKAVNKCRQLARAVFTEQIGAGEILTIGDDYVSMARF
jgi:predicted RNase H-like HicB family nuclease